MVFIVAEWRSPATSNEAREASQLMIWQWLQYVAGRCSETCDTVTYALRFELEVIRLHRGRSTCV